MNTLAIITVVGIIAVVILFLFLKKRRRSDVVEEMMSKRRGSCKVVSRAEFVQGMERMPVALCLGESQLFYENADFQAHLELNRIDEIEYDDELSTGKAIEDGRVLRVRSHGQQFEFIVTKTDAEKWTTGLPAHRMNEPGSVRAS